MQFSATSQNSISGKSIFGFFDVIFLKIKTFYGLGWFFPLVQTKRSFLTERHALLLVSTKSFLVSSKYTDFGHFWPPRNTFKVDFLNVQSNFQKFIGTFTGEEY